MKKENYKKTYDKSESRGKPNSRKGMDSSRRGDSRKRTDFKGKDDFRKRTDFKNKPEVRKIERKETVEIKKLGINGEGIGYIERKICFVKGALPQEIVDVEITNQTRNYYQGDIIEVTQKSDDRIVPECHLYRHCQGCSLLHAKYPLQLQYKKEAIRESIRKYTNYDLSKTVFKDVINAKSKTGFIDYIKIPIVNLRGKITFGVYQRDSKYLTPLVECFKQDAVINTCLEEIQTIFEEEKCKIYNDKFKTGLRFIQVKNINGQLQIVIITGKDNLSKDCVERISSIENVKSLFVSVNTAKHQEFDEVGYTKLYGNTRLEYMIDDNRHLVSVKSNIGENSEMHKKKIIEINKMLENSNDILSLHCGVGFIELQSNPAKKFTSFDEKSYHIEDAKLNAKYLHRENVTFSKGDIDDKVILQAKKKIHDTFLIQQERFGLSEDIKNSIRLSKVENVIITCDSHSTLAKDLADLEKFYDLEKIVALDTFVYTPYVTTIVKLKRKTG